MNTEIRGLLDDAVQRLNALVTQWREDAGRRELGRTEYRLSQREMAVYHKCANQLEQLTALLLASTNPGTLTTRVKEPV